ncbi:MAG TPA: hypothetical protein DCF63_01390 [Planctomycetaceae bacterium]|nr:hypothetical protein [Planctomycetaceae bacterium]
MWLRVVAGLVIFVMTWVASAFVYFLGLYCLVVGDNEPFWYESLLVWFTPLLAAIIACGATAWFWRLSKKSLWWVCARFMILILACFMAG